MKHFDFRAVYIFSADGSGHLLTACNVPDCLPGGLVPLEYDASNYLQTMEATDMEGNPAPTSVDLMPIYAGDEMDYYPVCDGCGGEHDYVSLTEEGVEELLDRLEDKVEETESRKERDDAIVEYEAACKRYGKEPKDLSHEYQVYEVYMARIGGSYTVIIDVTDEPYNKDNLEEVLDRAIDQALEEGAEGFFFPEGEEPEEFQEDYYYSSEHNRWLNEIGAPSVKLPDGRIMGGL